MEMRIVAVILIAMLMAVAVTESWASRPLKLKFIFEGDEVESNNNIKMQSGWFESLRGPVTSTGPSNCQNYRSPPSGGGSSCPVNEINAARINSLTDRSTGLKRGAEYTSGPTVKHSNSQA